MRYLHKWDSAIDGRELEVTAEWSDRLAGLTPEQIRHGLDAWDADWPPSSEEFRKACLGRDRKDASGGDRHYCPTHNGPTYRRETDRARLLSSDARDASRARVAEKIHQLAEALKGRAEFP